MAENDIGNAGIFHRSAVMQRLDVGNGVEPAAAEIALRAADDRAAVAHVILRDNEIAVCVQKACKMVIAADVLGNAVHDLNDRLGAFLGKPFAAVELLAAA